MRNVPFILFVLLVLIPYGVADAGEVNFFLDPVTPPKGHGFERFFEQTFTVGTFNFSPEGVIEEAEISGTWSGRLFWRPHIYLYLGDLQIADISLTHKKGIQGVREFVRQWRGWRTSRAWSYTFSAEEVAMLNEYLQGGAIDLRIVGKPRWWSKTTKFSFGEVNLSVLNSSGEIDSPDLEPPDLEVDPIEVEPGDLVNLVTNAPSFGEPISGGQVPEPISLLLVGSGLLGLVGLRKKFKK